MIDFDFSQKCYQCGNCKDVCPNKAIEYIENDTGDFLPYIAKEKCIDCRLCEKVCPRLNVRGTSHVFEAVSAYGTDAEPIQKSASGGIFYSIAKRLLEDGGYVCACVLQENMQAEHILSNSIEDLARMQGSKYIKSNTEKVLPQMENRLIAGDRILFCGTPCQIAAIENRFEKYRDQLFLIGLFCHGVPPQKVFDVYISWLEKRYNKKVVNVNFRSKNHPTKEHEVVFDDGSKKFYYKNQATYMCFFWGGVMLNTCFESNCQYKSNFAGDLMIGDAWGYEGSLRNIYDGRISNVLCLTEKGTMLLDNPTIIKEKTTIEHIYRFQPYLQHGFKANKNRNVILHNLSEESWKKTIYEYKLSSRKRDVAYSIGLYPVISKLKKIIKGKQKA